jgi:eukaryotic-like serine/threonine-protein kinase
MSTPTIPDDDRQWRLEEAMAGYLTAADAGRPPERESFLARYPDLRVELIEFLADLSALAGLVESLVPAAALPEPGATPEPAATLTLNAETTEGEAPTTDPGATIGLASATGTEPTDDPHATTTVDEGPHGAEAPAALPGGTRVRYFGDYELIRELGRGGMGIVYKARQISLNRPVALKMIKSAALAGEDELRRFQNEAEAVATLDHPHIVSILEVGKYDGQRYFTMKLIGGTSLNRKLTDYVADPRAAAKLLKHLAEAVHHAHQRGILHRDLKPANILLDARGEPFVTDFGLAKRREGDSELTLSGAILGTPAYMAPEQASGRRGAVTTAGDVYGLGAILYATLTGRAPFEGDSVQETLEQVRNSAPSAPSKINPRVPRDLETICLKCLEKDPGRRYVSADGLASDLKQWLAGEPIAARPVGNAARFWMWCRRRPVIAGLTGAVVVAVVGGLIGTSLGWLTALEAQAKEREQTELAGQRLYDARMNLVQQHWEDSNGPLVQQGLDEQLPANQGGIDRRGFEWFYWQRTMSSAHITLKGHTDSVLSVAFSPDGRRIASASWDGTVKVWDTSAGQEIRTLVGHTGEVWNVAYGPDGHHLASASSDGTVKLWDTAAGQEFRTLKGHTGPVYSVAYSPDGHRLASASSDGTVKLWDAATGRVIRTLKGYATGVGVAFSPDGRRIASASVDQTVKLWDTATGQEIRTLVGHTNAVLSVAFSPGGRRLASASYDGTVKLWDAATGQPTLTLKGHTTWVISVAFRFDGHRLASASRDGAVKVWDIASGQEIRTLTGHTAGVNSVAFSPDGWRLASASGDRTVKLWDTAAEQETLTLEGHAGRVNSVAFSPDGRRIASASVDQSVKLWDAATGQPTLTLTGHASGVNSVAFSPDGQRLASASGDRTAKLWDAATGQEIRTLTGHASGVNSVAFSPDGRRLASASSDATVKLWDAATGREIRTLMGHTGEGVRSVAFSTDGRRIASASEDGTVKLWDAATWQDILTLKGHTGQVISVAFSPDGRRLSSTGNSAGGTVKLWDAATGQEIRTLTGGHAFIVQSVAFSADGRRLASASEDGTVKLWDAATWQDVLTLKGRTGGVRSVAFSPDGQRLASASQDGTVKIWDSTPLTPEPHARDEALGLIGFLLERVTSAAELRDRIAGDQTISPATRATALKLAKSFWATRIRQQAESLVASLRARLLFHADALDAVCADPTINPEVRAAALALAQPWPDLPSALNDAAWALVKLPNRPEADSRRGLRLVETACQLEPNSGAFLNTLGVAQYRTGQYEKAQATLERSNELQGNREPAELAVLTMTLHRLHHVEAARATQERLREVMKDPKIGANEENQGFLREAESVLLKSSDLPEEVFAP